MLYGSRKEFSDIDIFMVGENPQESHSDFLDTKMQSSRDLRKGIKNFDVRTLIPLMNGEFLFGDRGYFEQSRQKILSQPISEEAIKHNLKGSYRMQRLRDENLEDGFLKNKYGVPLIEIINKPLKDWRIDKNKFINTKVSFKLPEQGVPTSKKALTG